MERNENDSRNMANENAVVTRKIENARKKGVKKGTMVTGIIGLLIVIVTALIFHSNVRKEQSKSTAMMLQQKDSFALQVANRDSVINQWLSAFDEIEKDMNSIKEKEKIVTVKSADKEFSKSGKEQIVEDIKSISNLLDANKKKIASLSAQLRKSGNTIKGLNTRIASLETTLTQYENDISDLKTALANKNIEIDELNSRMTALDLAVTQKDDTIDNQAKKLNEAYLTSGTYRELKDKGILLKEGGFLGIGKKEALVKDVKDDLFKKVDVMQTTTIPVHSRSARLITTHPSDSYSMIHENKNEIAYIEIKNPEEFWKVSKYAVVELIR